MYKVFSRIAAGLVMVLAGAACKTATTQPARVGAQPAAPAAAPAAPAATTAATGAPGARREGDLSRAGNPAAVQRRRRAFHVRHDSAPRAGRADCRMGRVARRAQRRPHPLRAHRRRAARRDRAHADWLRDRGQAVPDGDGDAHQDEDANGMVHDMLMPGMLSDEELAALDKARGPELDRLFLMAMIKHHEGAITMVDELFASYGAAQDDDVYRFASDVYADQTTEIERMTEDARRRGGSRIMRVTPLLHSRRVRAWQHGARRRHLVARRRAARRGGVRTEVSAGRATPPPRRRHRRRAPAVQPRRRRLRRRTPPPAAQPARAAGRSAAGAAARRAGRGAPGAGEDAARHRHHRHRRRP